MIRILLALLLSAATTTLSFAPIHCALELPGEFSDSAEPCCEFCHAGDLAATVPSEVAIALPLPTCEELVAQAHPFPRRLLSRLLRDRGPPR